MEMRSKTRRIKKLRKPHSEHLAALKNHNQTTSNYV